MAFSDQFSDRYDLAIVGSGFASSFFLLGYLRRASPEARVVVIERDSKVEHADRVEEALGQSSTSHAPSASPPIQYRRTGDLRKSWTFGLGFGGGSNCWWGNVPRFLPADFEMQSRFGVGRDWPISYADLAPYYGEVENVMAISGPDGPWPFPREGNYPQPPHRMNEPERILKQAYPNSFFTVPTARARIATSGRSACCGSGVCHLCPVEAKFTVQNGLMSVFDDPRVTVVLEAEALGVDVAGGVARSVQVRHRGREVSVDAELIVLGANALFNPILLDRSSLHHPLLGKGLHEQVGLLAEVHLEGVESFQGSTSVTGHSYLLYDDDSRRREMAACLVETWNVGKLRLEPGKWLQVLPIRMVFEDLPEERNRVIDDPAEPYRPTFHYEGHSNYTARAIAQAGSDLERLMSPLPVEKIEIKSELEATESHILGTVPMGEDPKNSIVDSLGVHHSVRNLVVLGGSMFPTSSPANPTLTISALALRAADLMVGNS